MYREYSFFSISDFVWFRLRRRESTTNARSFNRQRNRFINKLLCIHLLTLTADLFTRSYLKQDKTIV